MADQLTQNEWVAFVSSLTSGAIAGLLTNAQGIEEMTPGKFPAIDDNALFHVAALLAASVLDVNADHSNQNEFAAGAEKMRNLTFEYQKTVRGMSQTAGTPLLYQLFRAAGATPAQGLPN